MNYRIIEADKTWSDKYRLFCREAYLATYVRPDLGITESMFSEKAFNIPSVTQYFDDSLSTSANHKAWIAINDQEIIGGTIAYQYDDYCEMQTFYVKPALKGRGIGHSLYQKVLEFADGLPIQVDVVKYNQATIEMYKHWGFEINTEKGEVEYDWVEWPEKPRKEYRGIYMIKPGTRN